jgi:hypothetical protein
VRSATSTTFNDVLFAAWAGALRGWLALRGETPAQPLIARVPISLRQADEAGTDGNRISVVAVPVPANEGDTRSRLRRAHEAMEVVKRLHTPETATVIARGPPVNFALSTLVADSKVRLSWHGATRVGTYALAMVNVTGLAIACMTQTEDVCVGVHVDAGQVRDPWSLLQAFEASLADLEAVFTA